MSPDIGAVYVEARPYPWPFDGDLRRDNTALLAVGLGVEEAAYSGDVEEAIKAVRLECHTRGLAIFYVDQSFDRLTQSLARNQGADSLFSNEQVLETRRKNGFLGTGLEDQLYHNGIRNLIVIGGAIDGAVHATMRGANDRGYECVLVRDACGAFDNTAVEVLTSITVSCNGLFGTVTDVAQLTSQLWDLE